MTPSLHPAGQLEICAETVQACSAATEGGAHRIEICSALAQGGLTPSHALIHSAIEAGNGLPVHVLLRPRGGNFIYSEVEFKLICEDLEHSAALGVSGFVVGFLNPDGAIDEARTAAIVKLAQGREVTFHRAFDHARDLSEALEHIIALGCHRVLTSGGKPTVREGMHTIAALANQAAGRICIAAGGGVTPAVAAELLRLAKVDLHVSLRRRTRHYAQTANDPLWDSNAEPAAISSSDIQRLAALLAVPAH